MSNVGYKCSFPFLEPFNPDQTKPIWAQHEGHIKKGKYNMYKIEEKKKRWAKISRNIYTGVQITRRRPIQAVFISS